MYNYSKVFNTSEPSSTQNSISFVDVTHSEISDKVEEVIFFYFEMSVGGQLAFVGARFCVLDSMISFSGLGASGMVLGKHFPVFPAAHRYLLKWDHI